MSTKLAVSSDCQKENISTPTGESGGGARGVFEYLYRDAGNYKSFGKIILSGNIDGSETEVIKDMCEWGSRFVAEQIGVPVLYHELYQFSDGPIEDDVAFHEAIQVRAAVGEECGQAPWGSVAELLLRFRRVNYWDCRLSPHA